MLIASQLRKAVYVRLLNAAPHRRIDEWTVYAIDGSVINDGAVESMRRAFELIERYDPHRWARIRHDLDYVVLADMRGALGRYFPGYRGIHLSSRLLKDNSAFDLALVIVHEAAHARLDRAHIAVQPCLIDRMERRCAIEEMSFALRMTGRFAAIDQWIRQYAAMRHLSDDPVVAELLTKATTPAKTP
jgi:hypothetical protein